MTFAPWLPIAALAILVWPSLKAEEFSNSCQSFLKQGVASSAREEHSSLATLLSHLLDQGVLSLDEIEAWFDQLKGGGAPTLSTTSSALTLGALKKMIEKASLGQFELLLRERRSSHDAQKVERQILESETAFPFRRAQFVKFSVSNQEIHPATSVVPSRLQLQHGEFEIMETQFTAEMWRILGGSALPEHIVGDLPVHEVSLNDIENMVNRLHRGLIPMEQVRRVIPDHRHGDFYSTPTVDVYAWLLETWLAQATASRAYLGLGSELKTFAWFNCNSESEVREVATRKPFVVNSNKIYDLLGNIGEIAIADEEGAFWMGLHFGGDYFLKEAHRMDLQVRKLTSADLKHMRYNKSDCFPRLGFRLMRRYRGGKP